MTSNTNLSSILQSTRCHNGQSLAALTDETPVLIVFLRHAGCTFCREALSDLSVARNAIERRGVRLCLVHMGPESQAKPFISEFGLGDVPRISDPTRALYRAFGLERGRMRQLFGPTVIRRGMEAAAQGHGIGAMVGDGFQMPGVFLIHHGKIVRAFRHETAADRPDYAALACDTPSQAAHA